MYKFEKNAVDIRICFVVFYGQKEKGFFTKVLSLTRKPSNVGGIILNEGAIEMKKRILALALSAAMALSLAACSGGGDASGLWFWFRLRFRLQLRRDQEGRPVHAHPVPGAVEP